ncbi:MAG: hypothetical protein OXT69_14615 [Candidatus Poribacteria bacterium]|nr:hypothetical protein [Candidatus Poribacteria bacterium]
MKHTYLGWIAGTLGLLCFVSFSAYANETLIIVDDKGSVNELIPKLVSGAGNAKLEENDVYKDDDDRKAALLVEGIGNDGQKFNQNMPGWQYKIVEKPSRADEFRYITFAWKKKGGSGIQLQMYGQPGGWGHRYHAGVNEKNWNPSIRVSDLPREWEVHTRDLFEDWNEFTLTGIAFTAWSLDHGIWDHVLFHQEEDDPLADLSVDPREKAAAVWAELKAR